MNEAGLEASIKIPKTEPNQTNEIHLEANHTPLPLDKMKKTPEDLVIEKLQPTIERDQAGFDRRIYHYEQYSFSFRGREELPMLPIMKNSRTEIIAPDESPNWVPKEQFKSYLAEVEAQNESQPKTQSVHLEVPKTVRGVVELAIRLGSQDETLPQIAEAIKNGKYDSRALELIDQLVASTLIDYKGNIASQLNNDAEATVLLALLGDVDADNQMKNNLQLLKKLDDSRRAKKAITDREHIDKNLKVVDPVDPEELLVVHATDYKPEIKPDGSIVIRTTGNATGGKLIRNSIHFTLNHKVSSHELGNWDKKGYVVMAPFSRLIDRDGMPNTLDGVDTWWTLNPGEDLVLPDATVMEVNSEIDAEAVKAKIAELGYQYLEGGSHYIQDTTMQERIERFALEKGINTGLHAYSPESNTIHGLIVAAEKAKKSDDIKVKIPFDWKNYIIEPNPYFNTRTLGTSDPQTRRAVYASGMLVARGPRDSYAPDSVSTNRRNLG